MNEEEKKVIDLLKNIDKQKCTMLECPVVKNNIKRQLKIIELNRLIRKQSKEIEELNKSDASKERSSMKYYNLYKELVDKIKAKIEELKERPNKMVIDRKIPEEYKNIFLDENAILVLQELLEDK